MKFSVCMLKMNMCEQKHKCQLHRIQELNAAQFFIAHDFLDNPCEIMNHVLSTPHDIGSAVKIFGRECLIPRRQFAVGDNGLSYSFSGISVPARKWTPEFLKVRDEIYEKIGIKYNFVLVNTYDNGLNYIGYHRDDESDLVSGTPIASLSFGAVRDFLVKYDVPNMTAPSKAVAIPLLNNSLLLMGTDSQKNYKHSVPVRKREKCVRVNLTFRCVQPRGSEPPRAPPRI